MRNLIAISIVSSIAFGLLVAGCGGDDDNAQQIDKATFVKQANEICEQVSGKMAAEFASISQRESAKPNSDFTKTQILVVNEALIPGLEEELEQIRALGVPEEAKKETEALLAAYEEAIDETKANPKAAVLSSIPSYESVELVGSAFGVSECPVAPVSAN